MSDHKFKPYAFAPDLCVMELNNGETCNRERLDHSSEVIAELYAELAALVQRDNELDESYGWGTDDGVDDDDRSYYDEDKANLCAEFASVATRLLAAVKP